MKFRSNLLLFHYLVSNQRPNVVVLDIDVLAALCVCSVFLVVDIPPEL